MNSIDQKRIDEMARAWLENGCDAEGFNYSMLRVLERIKELEAEKASEGAASEG